MPLCSLFLPSSSSVTLPLPEMLIAALSAFIFTLSSVIFKILSAQLLTTLMTLDTGLFSTEVFFSGALLAAAVLCRAAGAFSPLSAASFFTAFSSGSAVSSGWGSFSSAAGASSFLFSLAGSFPSFSSSLFSEGVSCFFVSPSSAEVFSFGVSSVTVCFSAPLFSPVSCSFFSSVRLSLPALPLMVISPSWSSWPLT